MKLKSYLLILSLLLLSSCSVFNTPEKEVVTVTEIVRPKITIAEKPKSLKLTDVKWFIVNKDNGSKSVGQKRDEILDQAAGDFICFVDDDGQYLARILGDVRRALALIISARTSAPGERGAR